MNTHELLSRDTLLKEYFNAKIIENNNISEFLLYFVAILQLGIEANLISEEERNNISNLITAAISQELIDYDEDEFIDIPERQIANYMYVITIYLQHKTNWEAWQELNQIRSLKDAKSFIKNASEWMIQSLKRQLLILSSMHQTIAKLGVKNITSYYNELMQAIKDFMSFSSLNSKCDLKANHKGSNLVGYIFLSYNLRNTHDFYNRLCTAVYNFRIETSILLKVNGKNIMQNKKEESEETYKKQFSDLVSVNHFYQKELNKLIKERDDKLTYYYNSLSRPGRKKKDCNDDIIIERDFDEKSSNLKIEWDKAIRKLRKVQEESTRLQGDLLNDDYSLIDIIKEYAIWSFANKGIMKYPETMEERGVLIANLKVSIAISEFIEINKDNLTDSEIEYLKLCKESYK